MQSVSATLVTAIAAQEREPLARVRVDWDHDGNFTSTYDDLSANVESVTVDRSITTDLPDAARTITGYAAAEVTITLAGDLAAASMPVAQLLSAYNAASPLVSEVRITAPVDVDLGFRTSAGEEWVDSLLGKVRSVAATAAGRSVTLTGLDSRESVRTRVTLPVFVANDKGTSGTLAKKPGLDGQWVIDHVVRRNGFYASPPQRASVLMSATMHGSAWPETGILDSASYDVSEIQPAAFTTGNFAEALSFPTGGNSWLWYDLVGTLSATDLLIEGWFNLTNTAADQGLWSVLGSKISLYATYAAGVYTLKITGVDNTTIDTFQTKTLGTITAGAWHYIGVQIKRTAAGPPPTFTVTCRLDGTTLGTQTLTLNTTVLNPGSSKNIHLGNGQAFSDSSSLGPIAFVGAIEAVQVTTESSTTTWNNAYVPTAVLEPSLNQLTATPVVVKADPWELIGDVVKAEGGVHGFDEAGTFRFYNRNHMSGGAAVATISSLTNLTEVTSEETIDGVRNLVRVPATPLKLSSATAAQVWSLDEVLSVPASSTLFIPAQMEGGIYELDSSVTYGTGTASGSVYRGAKKQDGTGGNVSNLTFSISVVGDTALVTVTNPNAFIVYLVHNSLDANPGEAAFTLHARLVIPATGTDQGAYMAEATDATSVTAYGEQPIDLDDNPWMQSKVAAEAHAAALLAKMKDPHPVLTGVEIVADPRLQLADRVTVVDPDGLVLNHDFWVIGINTTLDGAGMSQRLALRQA